MVWYSAMELACLITPRSDMLFGCLLGMARRVFEAIVHPVCDRADRGPGVVDGTTADGALVAVGASVMNAPDIAGHGDAADVILIAVGTRDECRRDRVGADLRFVSVMRGIVSVLRVAAVTGEFVRLGEVTRGFRVCQVDGALGGRVKAAQIA